MKLRVVSISGFRSIRALNDLSLGAPTILAGHNDAGKSAIIDAILMLLGSYKPTIEDMTWEQSEPELDRARVDETSVVGDFDLNEAERELFGVDVLRLRRRTIGGDSPILQVETIAAEDARLRDYADLTLPQLKDRFETLELPQAGLRVKADFVAQLDDAASAAPQVVVWAKATAQMERSLPIAKRFDAAGAYDVEDAIRTTLQAAYRAHLDDDELTGTVRKIETQIEQKLLGDIAAIRHHIKSKVTDIGEIDIQPIVNFGSANGLKATTITITNHAGDGVNLRLSGAGRARRITLAVWEFTSLLLAESGQDIVLLYDEPDTHLDYAHQRELTQLIHDQAALPNVTVVVASHSMNMIDGVDIAHVVHIRHEDHRTVIDRLVDETSIGSHLGAIAASVGLRNTVLLHERLFVGVEGDSEARALPVLFKLATGKQLEACGIAIWPCRNNEGALRFAEFLVGHGRQVAFLVDADSRTTAKHIFNDERLRASGLDPDKHCLYIGDPMEIEDIFSDDQWAETANRNWVRNGDDQPNDAWLAEDFAGCRGSKFSSSILEMVRRGSTAAPGGKPEMLTALALGLKHKDDIPDALADRFRTLIARAN